MHFIPCFICRRKLDSSSMHNMRCRCPFGSPVCGSCKSKDGQRTYPGSKVCNQCERKGLLQCLHAQPLLCSMCSESGHIHYPTTDFCQMVQAWFSLRKNQSLVRRNIRFARLVEDWIMFSRFYSRNFLNTMMMNPWTQPKMILWTQPKKIGFFQIFLMTQMNYPVGPLRMIQIHLNLWESYPHTPLHIPADFGWKFFQISWVRKLICKIAVSSHTPCDVKRLFRQSYLHSCSSTRQMMMSFIIRYLMAQHAEIFALTI